MARLSICLLGPIEVTLDGEPLTGLRSDKVRALLAYLAIEAQGPHRREKLAGLLWPDWPEQAARTSLRRALANLRQVIDDHHATPPFLHISRQSLQFNRESDAWVDVTAFTDLLADKAPAQQAVHGLESAVELYRGDLMEGFSIPDSAAFEEWALLTRERLRRRALGALRRLVDAHEQRGHYEHALRFAWRQVELDPWREQAHRHVMRLLALSGQRGAALAQYETCCRLLAEELGVQPAAETTQLYELIRDGKLAVPATARPYAPAAAPPAFLTAPQPTAPEQPLFVARERELARLTEFLDLAMAGQGQMAFVIGEAGSGKTALLQEFSRCAQDAYPELVVAGGRGNAHTGVGDPYLPFREVLALLSGDVESRWSAGAIGAEHAQRLWNTLPLAAQALLADAPDLIDTLIPGRALLTRAVGWVGGAASEAAAWLDPLRELVERKAGTPRGASPLQSDLFHQYFRLLEWLGRQHPLLLWLDDLQWADSGSINLLFHLGRQLTGQRILIVGAYRPEEVALCRDGKRHPLATVVHEFQRQFGDLTVDLAQSEGHAFVQAFLDSEPNRLGPAFRDMLFSQTRGHPLFTIELLRGLQDRGDLKQDADGCWVQGPALDWESLPPRVEGVIAERVGRLPEALQQLLRVASVEGEVFTAEVVAQVLGTNEHEVIRQLSGELSKQHRLVVASSLQHLGGRRLSRYRFGHILLQRYLYSTLDPVQRGHLHEAIANQLEVLHRELVAAGYALQCGAHLPPVSEFAPQLARHYEAAAMPDKTAEYLLHAGIRAYLLSDYEEAIAQLKKGLAQAERLPESPGRAEQELTLLLAYLDVLHIARPFSDPEAARVYARMQDLHEHMDGMPFPLLNSVLWQLRSYHLFQADYEHALEMARQILAAAPRAKDPLFIATAHTALGWALTPMGEFAAAREHFQQLIDFADRVPRGSLSFIDQLNVQTALTYDSWVLWCLGYPDQALSRSREALALAEELGYPVGLAYALSVGGAVLRLLRGEPRAAGERVEAYLHLRSEKGPAFDRALGELYRGRLQVEARQTGEGLQRMLEALEASRATGTRHGWSQRLACLVAACLKAGQVEQGLRAAAEALAFVEETGERWFEAELHRLQGELRRLRGDEAGAEASMRQAVDVARHQQAKSWELRATTSLSRLMEKQGKREEARQQLAEIYAWFTEGFDTPDLQDAKALLDSLA
jgi:adenylate cyclase